MSISQINWKFLQVFGDKSTEERVADEDIISAISFDKTGRFLSLGDRAGRLIVFEKGDSSNKLEFQYLHELQSHVREFDFLKSVDIEEKINQIEWMPKQGNNLFVLTTNDKTIKLWKIFEKTKKEIVPTNKNSKNEDQLKLPKVMGAKNIWHQRLKRKYPMFHTYHINSISTAPNGQNFISSDDLRVYLWDIENTQTTFNVIDLKPNNFEELNEVITSSQFHPTHEHLFAFSTSKGIIKVGDLRRSSNCNKTASVFEEKDSGRTKNFFTEIVASISDISFSPNGQYLYSRDFLSVKIWDIKMAKKPLKTIQIYEPLKSKLCELYENECIFDKFSISVSPCSNHFITGLFNSNFHICDREGKMNYQFELNFKKKNICKKISSKFYEPLGPNYDFNRKVLKSTWNPQQNCVAIACLNCLYFYTQAK